MLSLVLTNQSGSFALMPLVRQLTWSGDYRQGARKLSFDLISSPYDQSATLPDLSPGKLPDLSPGSAVSFFQDEELLFSGMVVSREKATGGSSITVNCWDKGFYLLKNQGVYQFTAQTPDAIARRICADFGFAAGELAASTAAVTRNFIGVPLYRIIMTAYTLAAQQDGKDYQLRFEGEKLCVAEIKENDRTLVLEGGVNLQSASAADSIENTVTRAAIYDSDNRVVRTIQNEELVPLYGVLQRAVRQKDGEDAGAAAQKLLSDNGLAQTITVEALGNVGCVTGGTVAVKEPYTGLYGLFWITSDSHVWKDGQYYMKLSLSCKRLMDEQEAGSLPNKSGSRTASKTAKAGSSDSSGSLDLSGWEESVSATRAQMGQLR